MVDEPENHLSFPSPDADGGVCALLLQARIKISDTGHKLVRLVIWAWGA